MRPKILFINPWIYDFAAVNMWVRPLGLLQVAEYLSTCSVDLALIDCLDTPAQGRFHTGKFPKAYLPVPECVPPTHRSYARYGISLEDFQQRLRALLPVDAILITSVMTYWYPGVQEAIRQCRLAAPQTPICLGGHYPQLYPQHAVRHSGADVIFSGQADANLLTTLKTMGLALKPTQVSVPYYRQGFYSHWDYAPLLTSSGCPFKCAYCASSLLTPTFSQRNPDQVVQEILDLHALGVEDFAFYDDALLIQGPQHIHKVLKQITNCKLPIRFHTPNGLHVSCIDQTTADLMHAAGFKTIRLSLETVDATRQQETGGKIDNQTFRKAVAHLQQAGFHNSELGVYLMYGLPGQPLTEVWDGIHFLEELNLRINLTDFSPLPGTAVWTDLVARQVIPADIDPILTNNSIFSELYSGYTLDEIKQLKDRVAQHNQRIKPVVLA